MYSLTAAVLSAIANALLVLFGAFAWWVGLIVFFAAWVVIWATARMGIAGDSFADLGNAAFDFGDGGGWGGGDSGGGSSSD